MVESIHFHRVTPVGLAYKVELFVQLAERYSHDGVWKDELDLSWIASDKVLAYWNRFAGGRDGALDAAHPGACFRTKKILAVLGHRKTRFGCLELKVVYQGGDLGKVAWVEKRFLRLGLDMDERTFRDYCKAVRSPIPSDDFHVIAEETTVDIRRCPAWVMKTE
ncbi:hypothetical protein CPLU01_09864 [Colletotrichum plurivorum]|uniref:Uncharacterized protein n=1 Tax=Colletotrichum plurivorum TaxID=2175906 RepID=A0A8H6K7C8_9PEZI|nr:hypothetical protein CPLU01_09864 [Colletotrichum plurivorum]